MLFPAFFENLIRHSLNIIWGHQIPLYIIFNNITVLIEQFNHFLDESIQ